MTSLVSKPAPEFAGTALMPGGGFKDIKLSDYKGKYVVFFFYPLDFTFVCPSEIVAFNKAYEKFAEAGVELIGCSIDSHFTHAAWSKTPLDKGGIGPLKFPLLSDLSHDIAKAYQVHIDSPAVALRGLFLIDKEGILRHMVVNDLPLGRSVDEALRMVDALQFTEKHGEVCPANWKRGLKGMKADQSGVAEYLATMKE